MRGFYKDYAKKKPLIKELKIWAWILLEPLEKLCLKGIILPYSLDAFAYDSKKSAFNHKLFYEILYPSFQQL